MSLILHLGGILPGKDGLKQVGIRMVSVVYLLPAAVAIC